MTGQLPQQQSFTELMERAPDRTVTASEMKLLFRLRQLANSGHDVALVELQKGQLRVRAIDKVKD